MPQRFDKLLHHLTGLLRRGACPEPFAHSTKLRANGRRAPRNDIKNFLFSFSTLQTTSPVLPVTPKS